MNEIPSDNENELAPIDSEKVGTLRKYHTEHIKKRLLLEAERSAFTTHNGEKGRSNEKYFLQCLRDFLPKKFGVGTGFIETYMGTQSKQQDIIIYDDFDNSLLFICDAWCIYPIEMVNAVIEVKTTLTLQILEQSLAAEGTNISETEVDQNKKSLRWMADNDKKHYIENKISSVPPRFYIFAYRSKIERGSLLEKLKEYSLKYNVHCHGLYILNEDFLVMRKPLGTRSKYEHWEWENKSLGFFLNTMLQGISNWEQGRVVLTK